jgi:hypothetical protein
MPQQLLHYLELSPHTSQQSRVGVPEGMPSEPLLNSESSRHGTNVFAQDRLAPVWSSASVTPACENPILGLDVRTTFSPQHRSVSESPMHWHGLLRVFYAEAGNDEGEDPIELRSQVLVLQKFTVD